MATKGKNANFWTTLPGVVTAVAGLLTAVSGLLVALYQTGVLRADGTTGGASPTAVTSSSHSGSSNGGTAPGEGDALGGIWSGTAAHRDGSSPFQVRLEVATPCRLRESCGTIAVSSTPCTGRATLWRVRSKTYEFYIDKFTADSSRNCTPGAGDFFKLLNERTLEYTTGYADVVGVLHKVR